MQPLSFASERGNLFPSLIRESPISLLRERIAEEKPT